MTEHEHLEPVEPLVGAEAGEILPEAQPAGHPEFQSEFQSAPPRESEYGQTSAASEYGQTPAASEYGKDTESGSSGRGPEDLGPLFDSQHAKEIQQRWHEIQASFVDDPHDAVRQAGALNDEVVSSFTTALNDRKHTLEQGIANGDTEQLRIGLRQYRHMLDQILTL